jgi:hypothetical protein
MDIIPVKEARSGKRTLEIIPAHRSKWAAKSTRLAFQTGELNLLILL